MKIIITPKQFDTLTDENQLEVKTPTEIDVKFKNFGSSEIYNQYTKFFINGISTDNIKNIKDFKSEKVDLIVNLIDSNGKIFKVPLDKINFTKTRGIPIIDKDVIDNLNSVVSNKVGRPSLDVNYLKKFESGFPRFMTITLKNLYKNNLGKNSFTDGTGICDSEVGIIEVDGTNVPGQTWSILNYFNANPMVIKQLINWYENGEFNENPPENVTMDTFKKWITDNSEKLFMTGEYLDKLVKLNLTSYNRGSETENVVIKKLTESPYNIPRENIKQFCSGMKKDRADGQDIEITIQKGNNVYAQIKPSSKFETKIGETGTEYIVTAYNMKDYTEKPVEYIIFNYEEKLLIFSNKDYTIEKIRDTNRDIVTFKNPPKNLHQL
jgi:hypothetical protein